MSRSTSHRPTRRDLRSHQRADASKRFSQPFERAASTASDDQLVLKISPDLSEGELEDVVSVALNVSGRRNRRHEHDSRSPRLAALIERQGNGRIERRAGCAAIGATPFADWSNWSTGNRRSSPLAESSPGATCWPRSPPGAVYAQTYTGFIYRGPAMPALVQREMTRPHGQARHPEPHRAARLELH